MSISRTSPSEMEMFDICARRYWLQFIRRLPRIQHLKYGFGTIMHGAIERFLKDQPLWPDGWDIDKEDGNKRLDPADSQLIQILVRQAIDGGVIEKRPGGVIEQRTSLNVKGVRVGMVIDYHEGESRVEDHKSSKSTKYFKSAKALKKNIQMMLYGKWLVEQLKRRGKVPPRVITLVHNQFLKDYEAPLVRKREAELSPAEIDHFFSTVIEPMVDRMQKVSEITDPFDIEDPLPSACRAYGGCDFVSICTSAETVLQFEKRISNLQQRTANPEPEKVTMTPEEFLAKQRKKNGVADATASVAPVNPPKTEEPVAPASSPAQGVPPWADPICPLCSKSDTQGFNPRKGSPCRICLLTSKVSIEDYEWKAVDGALLWNKKGEAAPVAAIAGAPATTGKTKVSYTIDDFLVKLKAATSAADIVGVLEEAGKVLSPEDLGVLEDVAEVKMVKLADQPAPTAVETAASEAPAATPEPKKPEPETAAPKKRKRRTKAEMQAAAAASGESESSDDSGLILMIGCAPLRWDGKEIVMAEEILNGIEGYWENDKVFDRRGALRTAVSAGSLGDLSNMIIVQQGRDPDVDNLISSLMALNPVVVRGTIQ